MNREGSEMTEQVVQINFEEKEKKKTSRAWNQLKKNKGAILGLSITVFFILIALFGEFIAPFDPLAVNYDNILGAPSVQHWLGTDYMGRDILSRLLCGARLSLSVGFIAVGIGLIAGGSLGILAGFYKKLDTPIMRFVEILLAFPGLLLSITIVAVLGPGLQNVMIAIGIGSIPSYSRMIRGEVLKVKENEFVEAARALGLSDLKIIVKHVIPNILAPIIILTTFRLANAVLSASALSFLGLGAQPPEPEWGMIMNEGRTYMLLAPWLVLGPGFVITIAVLGFNLFGDGLRDALDPRVHDNSK